MRLSKILRYRVPRALSPLDASGGKFRYLPLAEPFAASPMNDNILYHALALAHCRNALGAILLLRPVVFVSSQPRFFLALGHKRCPPDFQGRPLGY